MSAEEFPPPPEPAGGSGSRSAAAKRARRLPRPTPWQAWLLFGFLLGGVGVGVLGLLRLRELLPPAPAAPAAGSRSDSGTNGSLPLYEVRIDPGELEKLSRDPNSNQLHPATFSADGKDYRVQIRHRGAWARSWPKPPFKIFFAEGERFRGGHCLNLNSAWRDPAFVREPLAYHIYAACGVPASQCRLVRLRINGQLGGLYVEVEQPDKAMLRRHGLHGATIYKASSEENRSDERALGEETIYPRHYEKENHKGNGHQALQEFCTALAKATNVIEFFTNHVQVDRYLSYLAVTALIQNWDCFNKNHFLVHDEGGSHQWLAVPWDLDRTLGDHWNGSFDHARLPLLLGTRAFPGPTGWNRMAERFLGDGTLRARFLDRVEQLLQTEFTLEKLGPVLDQYEAQIAEEAVLDRRHWGGASANIHRGIGNLKSFIEVRREHVRHELARLRKN
ncbi:MAG TPA: CotH kinase family protein [Candidatus Saccharimonadales bacterium]|nr:CotH kinase family protein [Candidatus Saccharimonadales bacterium]